MKLSDLKKLKDGELDLPDKHTKTPLFHAVEKQEFELFNSLIERGANIHHLTKHGRSLVHYAAKKSDTRFLARLAELGLDLDKRGENGRTPLIEACESAQIDALKFLINHNANVNATDDFGATGLAYAAYNHLPEIIQLLIQHGADPNKFPSDGFSPLRNSLWSQCFENAEILVTAGAKVTDQNRILLSDICSHTETSVKIATVEFLLKNGFDLNAVDEIGRSLLMISLDRKDPEFAKFLLKQGIDTKIKDAILDRTALDYAKENGFHELAKLL